MAVPTTTLEKYLIQVRRISDHREAGSEAKIRKMFTRLKKELTAFVGEEYVKYAEDDKLDFAILQKNREYARFLEEVVDKFDDITPEVQKEVQSLIEDTYKTCYAGMVDGVQKCGEISELRETFTSIKAISPTQVKAAVKNPVDKLTLKPTLERNRKNIISNIQREIGIGLNNGDRMSTMARRIQKYVDQDYRKSVLIARTEAHRVREVGFNDSADSIDKKLAENDSEYRLVKTWRTMQDGAVRHTNLANHRDMDDVSVLQDEDFELTGGAKAPCPGMSGIAAEDCNCRCYVERELMTDAEYFAKTGKHFPSYSNLQTKLKTLESKEADITSQIDNLQQDVYSNIWKDDVTVADYIAKQDKIQAKLDYFNQQFSSTGDSKWSDLINLTKTFEQQGKQYAQLYADLQNTQQSLKDVRKKLGIVEDKWSDARKAAAKSFSDRYDADKYYRPLLDANWSKYSEHEKYSIWEYTHNSNPMNKVLSGYHDTWSRSGFKGLGNTNWDYENRWRDFATADFENRFGVNGHVAYANTIRDLTNAIEKSTLADDVWLVRNSNTAGLAGLFEGKHISFDDAKDMLDNGDVSGLFNLLQNQDFTNHAFMSTGVSSDVNFSSSKVRYKIYAPKGTKAVYAEPQSYFGATIKNDERIYNAGEAYTHVGGEAEMILQRGTTYNLRSMKMNGNTIEVELDVKESPNYFKTGLEQTFNDGATSHPATN